MIFVEMRAGTLRHAKSDLGVRAGGVDDLAALIDLEERVFATDRMSRRSLRHFLVSPTSQVVIAERKRAIAGYALVLYRPNSEIARLYSIAVAPDCLRSGVGPALLGAAEKAARGRGCTHMRLEVHENNERAIELYRKCGYVLFGRHPRYYQDQGDAYRFQKALIRRGGR